MSPLRRLFACFALYIAAVSPSFAQTNVGQIRSPLATVDNLNGTRYVTPAGYAQSLYVYNWKANPASPSTIAVGSNTVTLPFGPAGLNLVTPGCPGGSAVPFVPRSTPKGERANAEAALRETRRR